MVEIYEDVNQVKKNGNASKKLLNKKDVENRRGEKLRKGTKKLKKEKVGTNENEFHKFIVIDIVR